MRAAVIDEKRGLTAGNGGYHPRPACEGRVKEAGETGAD